MKDPFFCKECGVSHDVHVTVTPFFDYTGDCIPASDWRLWIAEEDDQQDKIDRAWRDTFPPTVHQLPVYKVEHGCGCIVPEAHQHKLYMCRDCRERVEVANYDY